MNVGMTVPEHIVPDWGMGPFWAVILLGALSGIFGIYTFAKSCPPKFTFAGYSILFLGWTALLIGTGMAQGACPIHGTGQVFVFLAWSLLLFYLLAGTAYRLSFLGGLTGILVLLFASFACISGIVPADARMSLHADMHVGLAMLAYAALALSALASVALLIQNWHLKTHTLEGTYRKLPKLNLLAKAAPRLLVTGLSLLTLSIVLILGDYRNAPVLKLMAAAVTWLGYLVLLAVFKGRGMPPRWFALWNVVMFLIALTVIFASR